MIDLAMERSSLASLPAMARAIAPVPELELPHGLREDVRRVALNAWEERARSEYIGVMTVRHFHGLLVDLNAPLDLQELALTMLLDEQRHVSLCMAAARALGNNGAINFDLDELQRQRKGVPADLELLQMLCATYGTGEVVALALIRHALRVVPRSPFRNLLTKIARDEVLHGNIASKLIPLVRAGQLETIPHPGDDWLRTTAQNAINWMRTRDVVEHEEEKLFVDPEARAQLLMLGVPPSRELKTAYFSALDHDVPRAFLRAGISLSTEIKP